MKCTLCPRECGVDRSVTVGYCGCSDAMHIARADLHYWEEPCISGTNGSGTVFFSGCHLRCSYCQNYKISRRQCGKSVSPAELRETFINLVNRGAHNINLVNPVHYFSGVYEALRDPLPVPVVWNSSGYERPELIRKLSGKVQIFMPDIKYACKDAALYSNAPDYFEHASKAIVEMHNIAGDPVFDENGIMQSGVIIRHLVLPGNIENTKRVIDWVASTFRREEIVFSLMSQYVPVADALTDDVINRRLTPIEYKIVARHLEKSGITQGYIQELDSASTDYTPEFDLMAAEDI